MAQSPAAFFCAADPTADGHRGATGFRGFGDFSVDLLLLTGYGGGGENLLPTYVLCHVSRCTLLIHTHEVKHLLCNVDADDAQLLLHGTRLLWLNGFTGLELIVAHRSRSAQERVHFMTTGRRARSCGMYDGRLSSL